MTHYIFVPPKIHVDPGHLQSLETQLIFQSPHGQASDRHYGTVEQAEERTSKRWEIWHDVGIEKHLQCGARYL